MVVRHNTYTHSNWRNENDNENKNELPTNHQWHHITIFFEILSHVKIFNNSTEFDLNSVYKPRACEKIKTK